MQTKAELRARVGRLQTSCSPPVISLLAVPRRFFCFGSFGDFRRGALLLLFALNKKNR